MYRSLGGSEIAHALAIRLTGDDSAFNFCDLPARFRQNQNQKCLKLKKSGHHFQVFPVSGPEFRMICAFEGCSAMRALVVGDCKHCNAHFCVAHRIPEAHSCKAMALNREVVSKTWVVVSSDLASVAGLVMGTLTPKDGFR
jgi:hypothetical protein